MGVDVLGARSGQALAVLSQREETKRLETVGRCTTAGNRGVCRGGRGRGTSSLEARLIGMDIQVYGNIKGTRE